MSVSRASSPSDTHSHAHFCSVVVLRHTFDALQTQVMGPTVRWTWSEGLFQHWI